MTARLVLVSAAALYNDAGEILLAQRPEGKSMAGLWEFPGGKIESGETAEEALIRELSEELGIMVSSSFLYPVTFVSHTYSDFNLLMVLFGCRWWRGTPQSREGQALKWVLPSELKKYPAPEADVPLFGILAEQAETGDGEKQ